MLRERKKLQKGKLCGPKKNAANEKKNDGFASICERITEKSKKRLIFHLISFFLLHNCAKTKQPIAARKPLYKKVFKKITTRYTLISVCYWLTSRFFSISSNLLHDYYTFITRLLHREQHFDNSDTVLCAYDSDGLLKAKGQEAKD